MDSNRLKALLGVAGILLALLIWNWISGWGLVTVHVKSEPLAKVIRSIESQGRITIITNADLTVQAKRYINDREYLRGWPKDASYEPHIDYWNGERIWKRIAIYVQHSLL